MEKLKVLFELQRPKHKTESHFRPVQLILNQKLIELAIFKVFGQAYDVCKFEAQKVKTSSVFEPANLFKFFVAVQREGEVSHGLLIYASEQLLGTLDRAGSAPLIEAEVFDDCATVLVLLVRAI